MSEVALDEVETPVALVDLARVRRNAERVADYCRRHGLRWRPHVKTHKSVRIARIQLEAGAEGLTVATPREAEAMSSISDDLLLAYPPLGRAKLDRLMALSTGVRLSVALDSTEALRGLSEAASRAGRSADVLVEIDVGLKRVGVGTPEEAVALARLASETTGVAYAGILFYPGHIRLAAERQGPLLEELAARLGRVLESLDRAGLAPRIVSGGSTPTLWRSHEIPGLTEIRAGSCIFNDRESAGLGAAGAEDLAYTVLATVVSTAVPGQAVVDAGSKALAKEIRADDGAFGALLDRPEVRVSALSEEHGVLDLSGVRWSPRVGDRVRIVPNHVCVSANLQDHLLVHEGGRTELWEMEGRGRGLWSASASAVGA